MKHLSLNWMHFVQNVENTLYKNNSVALHAFHVDVLLCLDRITPSLDITGFQPRVAGSSFRSSGAVVHTLHDSLHSCTLIGWLFHCGERQDRVGLAPHEQESAILFRHHPTRCTFTMH